MIYSIGNTYEEHGLYSFPSREERLSFVDQKFPVFPSQQPYKRPLLYVDQLHEKCLFPERYLSYPGEPLEYERVLKQRIGGCEVFCKNDLREQAFSVASCIVKNYSDLPAKERACEKLRPLFLKHPLSLEVAQLIVRSMPGSSYFPLVACYNALLEKDWAEVLKILPSLQDRWKEDFVPELIREEKFDILVEVARTFSDDKKDQICDKLIEVNTLDSLRAAEKMASPSYLLLIQCWIALKENRLSLVEELVVLLPENPQKNTLIKALSDIQEPIMVQNPPVYPKTYKTLLAAVCIGFLSCIAAFFYRR